MMAGNPNWWSMNGMHSQSPQYQVYGSTSPISSNPSPPPPDHHHHHQPNQDFPVRSWSQLLLGGGGGTGEEERYGASIFQQQKKLENWEDQVLNLNPYSANFTRVSNIVDVKQEGTAAAAAQSQFYDDQFQLNKPNSNSWLDQHHQMLPVSSPTSCITTLSNNNNNNNILNFSGTKSAAAAAAEEKNQKISHDHSSECNSTGTGGASNKKARVQQSSAQPALKVRKEKLGDRITALHQLVSPFGKTDTASVLSEAIGYIRFLQGQIEALSSPYMRNASASGQNQHSVQERNCLFPEEPNQFLSDMGMDGRSGAPKQDSQSRSGGKDLRSRGLCLVPISCTQHVGNDNGADYWAPAALGGGF